MIDLGFTEVLLSGLLVVLAISLSLWWKIPIAKDMALGSVRAFVQLMAVGYLLKYIFELESPLLVIAAIMVMIIVGAQAASSRMKKLPGAFLICVLSITAGSIITIGLLLLLKIITFEARYLIPLAGMIVGNAMNSAALTIERIDSDIRNNQPAIEASLALGNSWRVASLEYQKNAAIAGMLTVINFLKTVGLVALPGAMTGMILAGIEPVDAIMLQIVVAFMLLSAVAVTSIVALELSVRHYFTSSHQLVRK